MIVVTGGTGLLGMELIRQLLSNGKVVRGIYNKTKFDFVHENFEHVHCDILDVIGLEEVMKDADELYHCAGMVSFASGHTDILYKINVEGTANVVNAVINASVKKMVHVSSVAALGRIKDDEMITEKMQWTTATTSSKYGQSKYLGELEVWRGIAEGLNAVIVNPTIILGPGNWDDGSTGIFKSVYNEFPWYTDGSRGFVDVRDVANAMILLMESDITAERFIINGHNESYHNLFNRIADTFNKKRPHKKVTPFLAAIVWRLGAMKSKFSGKKAMLTRETATAAMTKITYDNSKLKKYFPAFVYHDLDKTITDTCLALQQKLNIH